jgi:hypothetical protein
MSVVQRKAMLKAEGFFPHKKNAKGTTIIYSRKHPSAQFVRVVVDSGIDSKTGKVVGKVGVKLCFVNRQKSWRAITTQMFTTNTGLVKTIKTQEAAEKFVKTCKHCKAKKFTAKSGNVVCANACWSNWSGKKKSGNNTKKKSQKIVAGNPPQKKSKKTVAKKSQKKSQKFVAKILPGDLVTVEEYGGDDKNVSFEGSVLGIVTQVYEEGTVTVNWTANTSNLLEWQLPWMASCTTVDKGTSTMGRRLKVLSRKVEWERQ